MSAMPTESQLLRTLRRGNLPAKELDALLKDRSARKMHAVRLALARHPRTPRREALTLVETLYWRDLAALSADARVHPEVRRAADRDLLRRIPELAVAERIDLAKVVGRGTLIILRLDPDPRVLAAVLENRFTTEPDVVSAASRREAGATILSLIVNHPRWGLRTAVRSALLRNRSLPEALALTLLTRASRDDLDGLTTSPGVSRLVRSCAERVLAQRRGEV
jgi:hypothetical protein